MILKKRELNFLQVNVQIENDESNEWKDSSGDETVPVRAEPGIKTIKILKSSFFKLEKRGPVLYADKSSMTRAQKKYDDFFGSKCAAK